MNLKNVIKEKFQKQNANSKLPSVCPHCGKKLEFEFQHTQDTTVTTELVKLEKGE